MSEPDHPQPDALESLLRGTTGRQGDDRLRRTVLARTTAVIRFRRRLKRLALAATLAACYLAGMATTGAWRVRSPQPATAGADLAVTPPSSPTEDQRPAQPATGRPVERPASPRKLTRFEVLRRSGDAHLGDPADLLPAIHDYALALNAASDVERAIAPGRDNWLLMALKDARLKETENVRRTP